MKNIITNSAEETKNLASHFIKEILSAGNKESAVVALEGDLGSGKTTFAQGIAWGLGIEENITSPTFVLVKRYGIPHLLPFLTKKRAGERFKDFYHIDCYRIEKFWQLQELGFEEIINNQKNIVVIEWPEKIVKILPGGAVKIKFEYINENKRKILFE